MKRVTGMLLVAAMAAAAFIAAMVEPTPPAAETSAPAVVYVTREHSKKFHAQECRGLQHARAADITRLSREDAEAAGYLACGDCFAR